MSTFHVSVTTGAGTPIYRQIVDQVRLAVATGALRPGQAMPSVRGLAERLVVNVNTVVKAYAELVRDGLLESHHGLGYLVAAKRQVFSRAERLRRLLQALEAFVHEAVFLDFSREEIRQAFDAKLGQLDLQARAAGGKP
jgi:GntR family transcriptional regulator